LGREEPHDIEKKNTYKQKIIIMITKERNGGLPNI
jgi:hypothetical protein